MDDERTLQTLLAPLERVEPAAWRTPRRTRRLVVIGLATMAAAGVAVAFAARSGVLHDAKLVVDSPPARQECELLGGPATEAQAFFAHRGLTVSWRYTTWGPQVVQTGPGGLRAVSGGETRMLDSVPPDSVVYDLAHEPAEPGTAIVFVQAANDPNAPKLVAPRCRE
jgi:hypothetical protein